MSNLNLPANKLELATLISKSTLCPREYQGNPTNTAVAIMMGQEIGLNPFQALQNITVINGRPALWGDAMLALVQNHPAYEAIEETIEGTGENLTAICRVKRKKGEWHEVRFSVSDARTAGLWGKNGPWKTYPKRMLALRARGFALRNQFADALKGLISKEEAEDLPPAPKNITPSAKTPAPAVPTPALDISATDNLLNNMRSATTEEALREAYKEAYSHAKYMQDASFIKEAKNLKDEMKEKLGVEKGEENETISN